MKPADVWDKHARQWNKLGPPLRPCVEDIDFMEQATGRHCVAAGCVSPRAILLGVTPEIARMRWPAGTELLAVDNNEAVIANVWPGNPEIRAEAVCGDWTKLPVRDASCDVVVGDGSFITLQYPEGYAALADEIRRVLKRGGLFAIRVFIRPDAAESLTAVFNDLRAGRIGSFHAFKWRLAMALHTDLRRGVRLGDIWNAWNEEGPDVLARTLNWPIETVGTIDAYCGLDTRYTYPTLSEFRHALSTHFSETACVHKGYELGQRCPTFLFTPR
jgi:SAM-dependent methyltransferase